MKTFLISLFGIFLFVGGSYFATAAIIAEIVPSPEYPKAYEDVSLTIRTFSFDVDLAFITWKVDSRVFASGVGVKSIKVNTKSTGTVTPIEARAVLPNGDSVTLVFNLSAQSVDLVWEALESYTPPFYEGLSLPGEGALVKVVAFPSFVENGVGIPPNNVAYAWTVNDQRMPAASGLGKQTLTTRLDYLSDSTIIKVLARTPGGSVAESSITILPNEIDPLFYLYDPILGVNYAHAITKRFEMTKEASLKLEPYYLSRVAGQDTGESYFWTIDGVAVTTQTPTLISLRPKEKSYGVKNLAVAIENTKRRLQQAAASLEIVFDSR